MPVGHVAVELVVGGRLVGQHVGDDTALEQSREQVGRVGHDARRSAPRPAALSVQRAVDRRVEVRELLVAVAAWRGACRCASRRPRPPGTPRRSSWRRAAARRPCRRGRRSPRGAPAACRRSACARRRRRSRRSPAGSPACRCRSSDPAVIWPYIVSPSPSRRRNSSQVAQCGTRLALAMSTRGASSCVRKTPTGLPDCTSSVSSSRERAAGVRDDARRSTPSCAPPCRCRRTPPGPPGARRPPGRGCS